MTIAWRYQNLPKVENATQNKNRIFFPTIKKNIINFINL